MAKWVEEIPKWIEAYPQWVEGLSTPQWVECGWIDFSPQWVDGPVCPAPENDRPYGMGWDIIQKQEAQTARNKKIKDDDEICLQAVLRCSIIVLNSWTNK